MTSLAEIGANRVRIILILAGVAFSDEAVGSDFASALPSPSRGALASIAADEYTIDDGIAEVAMRRAWE